MKYAFIGLGNMASAILSGMKENGTFDADEIYGYNRSEEKTTALAEKVGLIPCASAREAAEASDVIVLAVKPQMLTGVLPQISPAAEGGRLVITIAAGKDTDFYSSYLGYRIPVVRAMPNINARVGASITAVCGNGKATREHVATAKKVFSTVGAVVEIPESQFPAFGAIGGASVAFAYTYMDALASAGVKAGFSRSLAMEIATATVFGSAHLLRETGEHPMNLVDQVCSPGGTTIEGMHVLKMLGFESAIHQAVEAVIQKDELIRKG